MPGKYLVNTNTKEIHEYERMVDNCRMEEIKEDHKFWLDYGFEIIIYCVRKDYNGCKWCLPHYHANDD